MDESTNFVNTIKKFSGFIHQITLLLLFLHVLPTRNSVHIIMAAALHFVVPYGHT